MALLLDLMRYAPRSDYRFKRKMITNARGITIGQLAKAAGVNLETVRYYERIGLIAKPARTSGGQRCYSGEDARHLAFVRRARELGFSIDDIRALLKLATPGKQSCAEVQSIASAHLTNVQIKLADLARLEKILAATVDQCGGAARAACPILEMLEAR
jgi:MerR family transcriptional regulator, mercuric resistance operon regulatory protein